MKQKRAQSAVEFLITYGWAFLVILVVIGALIYFDVLSPTRFIPDSCRSDNPQFVCSEAVFGVNNVQFAMRNSGSAGYTNIEVDYDNADVTSSGCTVTTPSPPNPTTLTPGNVSTFSFTCDDNAAVGERLAVNVPIRYNVTGSGLGQRTAIVTLSGNLR